MAREKKKKRPSIWEESPYGETDQRGTPDIWRAAFGEAMTIPEAEEILGDDSPWSILGIQVGSSMDIIKSAWRRWAMKLHPDHNPDRKEWAERKFIALKAAYVKLGGKE